MLEKNTQFDIVVSDLKVEYADSSNVIFDGISFSIKKGNLVVFVGPSGCGKSTLLKVISGLESSFSGEVNIVDPVRGERRASIEQSPALFPWRTAFQNAFIGAEIKKKRNIKLFPKEIPKSDVLINSVIDDFRLFKLTGFENCYPDQLSGGMQQRVAIIRALQSEPKLLFCDEPFSAIDFVTRLYLNTEFKKISRNLNCTTLFVTHNIEEAIFLADRVIVLNGRPCEIVDDFSPVLTVDQEDAVKCRKSPEFPGYFERIWEKLRQKK